MFSLVSFSVCEHNKEMKTDIKKTLPIYYITEIFQY